MNATGDLQLLKRINRSVLLRLVRSQPNVSRARLAALSGLTKSTVSALVRELLDEQWLTEADAPVPLQSMGRPSTPLNLDNHKRVLIGIEVAVDCVRLVCVSLNGTLLTQTEAPLSDKRPERACAQVSALVGLLSRQLEERNLLLTGVGVCLPGAVDDATGIVRLAPNLGWRDVPFLSMVSAELSALGIPAAHIYLQNDADAAALSEYEFGEGSAEGPLIFINCDVGVGAGVVLNDRLFTGAVGTAGEIGHSILQFDGPLCSCGRKGCAETFIGARALRNKPGIAQAGQYLGMLMQNLDATFNPRTLVVGGRSCMDYPSLIDAARTTLQAYAHAAGLQAPEVRPARFGVQAAAVGAAALVLHRYLRPFLKEKNHVSGN